MIKNLKKHRKKRHFSILIYKKLCLLSIFFICNCANGQSFIVSIKGEVLDSSGVGILNSNIKIAGENSHLTYFHSNLGISNTFTFGADIIVPEKLAIYVAASGYFDTVIYINKTTKYSNLDIVLRVNYQTLKGVILKTTPSWTHGDTTFFIKKNFADGTENKLKDLLIKLPDFEINEMGELFYKKKVINKILIDGEELFSDKIGLLLNNFPARVLKNIQAIQNQGNNVLLNGLQATNNTIINLTINNENQKAIFGNGEIGIGTEKKYNFNSVLFSMLGKLKSGYIGNFNSIGNGIEWQQLYEIKNDRERLAEHYLKTNISAQTIPNFENRWYINNAQKDNRVQFNIGFNKKFKTKTEVNYFGDKQKQTTNTESSFYNGNNFYFRFDSTEIYSKPTYLKIKETFIYSINKHSELRFVSEFFKDNSTGYQNSLFEENRKFSFVANNLVNNWKSLSSKMELTSRRSETKANHYYLTVNKQTQKQILVGISPYWPDLYYVLNQKYDVQFQVAQNNFQVIEAGFSRFGVLHKYKTEMAFKYNRVMANLSDKVFLNDIQRSMPSIPLPFINNQGKYVVDKIAGQFKTNYKFVNKNSASADVLLGYSKAELIENSKQSSFVTPEYIVNVFYNFTSKAFHPLISAQISQIQVAPYELVSYIRPVSSLNYVEHKNIQKPLKKANINYLHFLSGKAAANKISISLDYNQYFTSFAIIADSKGFVRTEKDSLVNQSTNNYTISTNQIIPSLFLNAVIELTEGYNRNTLLIVNANQILKAQNNILFVNFKMKKNWYRKIFGEWKMVANISKFSFPKLISSNVSENVINIQNTLSSRYIVSEKIFLRSTIHFFNNSLFTDKRASFAFVGAELNLKLFTKTSFDIQTDNLTNTKYFYNNLTNGTFQSFYNVPLIKRRIFFSMKYDF